MHKSFLLMMALCQLTFFSISSSMNPDDLNKKRMQDFQTLLQTSSQKNTAQLRSMARNLSENPQNFKRIAILTHPDKNQGNAEIAELFKVANEGYTKKNKAVAVTANDITEVTEKTKDDTALFEQLKTCDLFLISSINSFQLGSEEISQAFVDNNINTLSALILNRLITQHSNDIALQKYIAHQKNNLTILEKNQEMTHEALKMHTEYREDLKELQHKTNQKIQNQLKKHLNKENKQ